MKSPLNKKQTEEKIMLHHFLSQYKRHPKGRIIKTESPDFIVRINPQKSIGIELTRLHQPDNSNGFSLAQVDSTEAEIIRKSKAFFKVNSVEGLRVTFYFKKKFSVQKKDINIIATKISKIINGVLIGKNSNAYFSINIEVEELPDCLESIHLLNIPNCTISFWENGSIFQLPDISQDLVRATIEQKERKIPLYAKKKLSFIWLIIITDMLQRSTSHNLHNQIEKWIFSTAFSRVFLFEITTGKIYELI